MNKRISIFFKLFSVMLLAVVLINASVYFSLKLAFDLPEDPPPSPRGYAKIITNYLVDEIGNPPDTVKAKKLVNKLGISIRVETRQFTWGSSEEVMWEKPVPFPHLDPPKGDRLRNRREFRSAIKVVNGETVFYFKLNELPPPENFFSTERAILWLLLFLSLIVVVMFFILRKIFTPIQTLIEGTKQISKGNFSTTIDVKQRDELGELASSFNAMTTKVSEMLKREKELLLDVSHEFRSPLTRMNVALELLPDGVPKAQIKNDLHELDAMLNELLETERLQSANGGLKKSQCSLHKLAKEVFHDFLDDEQRLILKSDKELIVNADEGRLRLLLRNLISNALKYSQNEVIVEMTETLQEAIIKVCDTGKGIATEEINFIFEPFYRTDAARVRVKNQGGYGLGLYLCKKIVLAHGGTIKANSDESGTCIEVHLPK